MWIVLLSLAQVPPETTRPVARQATATVRIVRPATIRLGRPGHGDDRQARRTNVQVEGQERPASLVEFF